jgi:opacity protein-like surface antigen
VLSSTSIVTTPAPIVTQSENFHLLGSARARIGLLAWPNLLLYGTGGLAWTRFEQSIAETITRATEFGWAAGAGGEFKITDHWLFRVEYLHYDFGHSSEMRCHRSADGLSGSFRCGSPAIKRALSIARRRKR